MNLQEYINFLQEFINQNPNQANIEVWTADDAEGNGYQKVEFLPSLRYIPKDSIAYGQSESCYKEDDMLDIIRDYDCIYREDFQSDEDYNNAIEKAKNNYLTVLLLN